MSAIVPTTVRLAVTSGILGLGSLVAFTGPAGAAVPECEGQPATIIGTSGADRLYGTPADDVVWLGGEDHVNDSDVFVDVTGGNDLICQGGLGDAHIQAGPGDDVILLTGDQNSFSIDVFVYGGAGNDRIDAGDADARQHGGAGDDVLTGGARRDELFGGAGADQIDGLEGEDWTNGGAGDDQIDAGPGNDLLIGSAGSDTVEAGAGRDELAYSYRWPGGSPVTEEVAGVSMDLAAGVATSTRGSTQATGVECWTGTPFADTIDGSPGPDCINGSIPFSVDDGEDTIRAFGGDDEVNVISGTVDAGDGDDSIQADLGAILHGGTGRDTLRFKFFGVDLDAREGIVTDLDDDSSDKTTFDGLEIFVGSPRADHLRGSGADETFYGLRGRDVIRGRGGDDHLDGGRWADDLSGGRGVDVAMGGEGKDRCKAETERSCERDG